MGSFPVDLTGAAVFSTTLGLGEHSRSNGQPFFLVTQTFSPAVPPLSSAVVSTAPNTTPDFTLKPSGSASQAAMAGVSVAYGFGVSFLNGPLSSPIFLTVTGMPPGASCQFQPGLSSARRRSLELYPYRSDGESDRCSTRVIVEDYVGSLVLGNGCFRPALPSPETGARCMVDSKASALCYCDGSRRAPRMRQYHYGVAASINSKCCLSDDSDRDEYIFQWNGASAYGFDNPYFAVGASLAI